MREPASIRQALMWSVEHDASGAVSAIRPSDLERAIRMIVRDEIEKSKEPRDAR